MPATTNIISSTNLNFTRKGKRKKKKSEKGELVLGLHNQLIKLEKTKDYRLPPLCEHRNQDHEIDSRAAAEHPPQPTPPRTTMHLQPPPFKSGILQSNSKQNIQEKSRLNFATISAANESERAKRRMISSTTSTEEKKSIDSFFLTLQQHRSCELAFGHGFPSPFIFSF